MTRSWGELRAAQSEVRKHIYGNMHNHPGVYSFTMHYGLIYGTKASASTIAVPKQAEALFSLYTGYSGTDEIAVGTLSCTIKRTQLMEKARKAKEESHRNRGKTRANGRAFT